MGTESRHTEEHAQSRPPEFGLPGREHRNPSNSSTYSPAAVQQPIPRTADPDPLQELRPDKLPHTYVHTYIHTDIQTYKNIFIYIYICICFTNHVALYILHFSFLHITHYTLHIAVYSLQFACYIFRHFLHFVTFCDIFLLLKNTFTFFQFNFFFTFYISLLQTQTEGEGQGE